MRVARHCHRVRVTRVRVGEIRTEHFSLPSDSPFSFPHSLTCTLHNASLCVIGAAFGRTGSKVVVVPSPRFDGVNCQPHPWCFSLWCFFPAPLSLGISLLASIDAIWSTLHLVSVTVSLSRALFSHSRLLARSLTLSPNQLMTGIIYICVHTHTRIHTITYSSWRSIRWLRWYMVL